MLEYAITIKTDRPKAQTIARNVFPYIRLLQQSHVKNMAGQSRTSKEYLTVHLYNSLLIDIDKLLQKKLFNTSGHTVKIKLSVGHAVALYCTFLLLPLSSDKIYENMVRNEWLDSLESQLFAPGILLPFFTDKLNA